MPILAIAAVTCCVAVPFILWVASVLGWERLKRAKGRWDRRRLKAQA